MPASHGPGIEWTCSKVQQHLNHQIATQPENLLLMNEQSCDYIIIEQWRESPWYLPAIGWPFNAAVGQKCNHHGTIGVSTK